MTANRNNMKPRDLHAKPLNSNRLQPASGTCRAHLIGLHVLQHRSLIIYRGQLLSKSDVFSKQMCDAYILPSLLSWCHGGVDYIYSPLLPLSIAGLLVYVPLSCTAMRLFSFSEISLALLFVLPLLVLVLLLPHLAARDCTVHVSAERTSYILHVDVGIWSHYSFSMRRRLVIWIALVCTLESISRWLHATAQATIDSTMRWLHSVDHQLRLLLPPPHLP